jgi:hypothetical protein
MNRDKLQAVVDRVRVNFPAELIQLDQWVLWRLGKRKGKQTKVPYTVDGRRANSTDPTTWTSFEKAARACLNVECDGVGFVFTEQDPYAGVDFDKCIDAGKLQPQAVERVRSLASYTELSQSGTGLHVIVRGKLPPGGRKSAKHGVEMYESGRFFVVTGDQIPRSPTAVEARQAELEQLHAAVFGAQVVPASPAAAHKPDLSDANGHHPSGRAGDDDTLIERMFASKHGAEIRALWDGDMSHHANDHSGADLALCNHLAFWTRHDAAQMDRLFRRSALYRQEKWDRNARSGETYGQGTIRTAIEGTPTVYTNGNDPWSEEHPESGAEKSPKCDGDDEAVDRLDDNQTDEDDEHPIYKKYPFLAGIPIEPIEEWRKQWCMASATEGGETRSMLAYIDYWATREQEDVVPGVFPRGETILLAGESGVGKTFLGAKTYADCLAGSRWWGRWPIPKLTPLYCLVEDQKGFAKRLLAHLNTIGWKPGDTMGYVRDDLPRFFVRGEYGHNTSGGEPWFLRIRADQYRGTLPERLDVVFVDYLRDAAPGAIEESNNDMALVMDGVNQLARALGVLVVLFQHRGYQTDKPTRGATVVVDKSHAVFVLSGKLDISDAKAQVKIEAAKPPKGIARPEPMAFRLNGESGNTPIVEWVDAGGDALVDEIYQLLRGEFPGQRFRLSQLQGELPAPEGVTAEAWKQRLLRATKTMQRDKIKYPGIDYQPGRGGGYRYDG